MRFGVLGTSIFADVVYCCIRRWNFSSVVVAGFRVKVVVEFDGGFWFRFLEVKRVRFLIVKLEEFLRLELGCLIDGLV